MEVDEKAGVSTDFLSSTHGKLGCTSCHAGAEGAQEKAAAHAGLVRDPAEDPAQGCGSCHADTAVKSAASSHVTLSGFTTVLARRGAPVASAAVHEAFGNHCAECHATCGQCHVSRPVNQGGGLISGHDFKKTPPMKDTCNGCHGGRVGPEYMGQNEGISGDIHWTKGGMVCTKCHKSELHGTGQTVPTRYEHTESPTCLGCHQKAAPGASGIQQHDIHGDNLSCQVCHSAGAYKSCSSCHVGKDQQGLKYRKTEETEMTFKIGINPDPSSSRPYKYVPVRHAPAVEDIFAFYGVSLLPDFDAVPTWKPATPHNIQRKTEQNASCNSCHGKASLFLTEADIIPQEKAANEKVVVPKIPAPIGG